VFRRARSVSVYTPGGGGTPGKPIIQVIGTQFDSPRIIEIGLVFAPINNTTQVIGLGRPDTSGVPHPNNSGTPLMPEGVSGADSTIKLVTQWTEFPTAPAHYFRRCCVRALTGGTASVVMQFGDGIHAGGAGLALFNIAGGLTAADLFDVWMVVE
jgi:hypothetical protein